MTDDDTDMVLCRYVKRLKEWHDVTLLQYRKLEVGIDKDSPIDEWNLRWLEGPRRVITYAFSLKLYDQAILVDWLYEQWQHYKIYTVDRAYHWSLFMLDIYDLESVENTLKQQKIQESFACLQMLVSLASGKPLEKRKYRKRTS